MVLLLLEQFGLLFPTFKITLPPPHYPRQNFLGCIRLKLVLGLVTSCIGWNTVHLLAGMRIQNQLGVMKATSQVGGVYSNYKCLEYLKKTMTWLWDLSCWERFDVGTLPRVEFILSIIESFFSKCSKQLTKPKPKLVRLVKPKQRCKAKWVVILAQLTDQIACITR